MKRSVMGAFVGGFFRIGMVVLASAMAMAFLALPVSAQYVHGLVVYVHTEAPVSGASVLLMDSAGAVLGGTVTSSDGRFAIPVTREGPVTVYVEHPSAWAMIDGPLEARYGENTMAVFRLQPSPIALEGMSVEVEARSLALDRTGFYRRRNVRPGVFMDIEAVKKRQPLVTTDLLRTVPGVRLLESRQAGEGVVPIMSYAERTQLDPSRPACFPRVVLDGFTVNIGGTSGGPTNLDQLVHPMDIQGIEVYRSPAESPVEFGGGLAVCGMIVIWTRLGGGRS